MKFSEKWLREWVNPKIDSDILYDQITNSGIEIEHVDVFEPIFCNIVVGKIVQCTSHSEFNKLKIVKVDVGKETLLNIVCGAANCRSGIKVAVAIVGAILPNKLTISIKNFKGALSEGMLCSFDELGLFDNRKEIIEFSEEVPIGIDVNDYLSLKDNIIKVNITPNRPDGLSILGLSRNISAMNNLFLPSLECKLDIPLIKEKFKIEIQDKKECMSYAGRIIKNININVPTPFWMKEKLFLCNILSEDIITDVINYVLIEIGQPINILDSDNIHELIIARMAHDEEVIVLKNNKKIFLNKRILVFSDRKKVLSIPGNINCHTVSTNKNTKNIFLNTFLISKQAIFDILKKISSNKILDYYNHGVDPLLQIYALEYATKLLIKICGGIPGPITYNRTNSSLYVNNIIRLYYKTVIKIIGISIDKTIVSNILYSLNYKFIFKENYWDLISPSWRFDILIEEDVVSDILRIYGYNNVRLMPLKENLNVCKKNKPTDALLEKSKVILVNKGYHEVITYGFINPKVHDLMFHDRKKLLISNPISQDMSCMRTSLWPGLLKVASYNKNRKQENIRFFESGLCFSVDEKQDLGIKQECFLGGIISGNYSKENWYSKIRKLDFYDLKGDIESVLEIMYGLHQIDFRRATILGLHPEQSASIYLKNNIIGSIGAIDPRIEKKLNISKCTFVFEISLSHLLNTQILKIQEISKFPISRRDISILVSSSFLVSDVLNECKKIFVNKKVEINLFDVYSCKEFSGQKNSLGISLIFQHEKKTLIETEINFMVDNCIGVLKKKFQVILRK